MNLTSSVSADRFRGNIHKKLSIINLSRLTNQNTSAILTNLNTFSFIEFLQRNTRIANYNFIKNDNMTKPITEQNNQLSYIKHKTLRLFLNNALKQKFYKDYHIINVKKIIKNKRKRKEYAIRRTVRLDSADPSRGFTRLFLKKLFFGKRLNPMRTSLKQRKLQRYKYILRLRSFRQTFLERKNKNKKKIRFIKNMLYFSHTKLHNECRSLNEFKNINFKRKRFLFKTMSTMHNSIVTLQPQTFLTQKSKNNISPLSVPNTSTSYEFTTYLAPSMLSKYKTIYNNPQLLITSLVNLTLLKSSILTSSSSSHVFDTKSLQLAFPNSITKGVIGRDNTKCYNNLVPDSNLNKIISKNVINSFKNSFFQENVISWYHNTMIRFMEECTGKKILFQFYPFMNQDVTLDFVVRYKR
jgi:hypothetical protein